MSYLAIEAISITRLSVRCSLATAFPFRATASDTFGNFFGLVSEVDNGPSLT
jgi:hypothetical protein